MDKETKPAPVVEKDPGIDEYAIAMFGSLGYDVNKLPAKLVEIYKAVKQRKDRIAPGRLNSGEFAFISYMSDCYAEE